MADPILLLPVLLLLGIANGTPIFAKALLKDRFGTPLDGGLRLADGRPVFGNSKTIRGVLVSIVSAALAAWLLGLEWSVGGSLAAISMAGDLLSSFIKRRLGLKPHTQALGLDQIPEALLPLLMLHVPLGLSWVDILTLLAAFIVAEIIFSQLLFRLHIRDRPY
jgi:CDP-2,3-bis-(O-geranylgeranyl)-sn-glycerol synthase